MVKKLHALVLGLLFAAPLAAIPTDCSHASMLAAIGTAVSGETVTVTSCGASSTFVDYIPVGTSSVPKSITIDLGGYTYLYAVPNTDPSNQRSMFTVWSTDGSDHLVSRITNGTIIWQTGAATTQGIINAKGGGGSTDQCYFRVDHIVFTNFKTWPLATNDEICGVFDHNSGTGGTVSVVHSSGANLYGGAQGLGSLSHGVVMGGPNAIYIEDNNFVFGAVERSVFDAEVGGRQVARGNILTNSLCEVHGLENGLQAGAVQTECYLNDMSASTNVNMRVAHFRSSTGAIWGNKTSDVMTFAAAFDVYRTDHDYVGTSDSAVIDHVGQWRKCTGVPAYWSGGVTLGPGGNSYDQVVAGGPFATGTASATGSGTSMQDTGAGWPDDFWVGYSVINKTKQQLGPPLQTVGTCGSTLGNSCSTTILSNTADTLTLRNDHISSGNSTVFSVDDVYEIWKATTCLNQTGMDAGSELHIGTGAEAGIPYWLGPGGAHQYSWPNQVVRPTYVFLNTDVEHGLISAATATPTIVESRHFLNQNNGFYTGYLPTTNGHSRCTIMTFNASCGVGVIATLGGLEPGQVYPTCTQYVGLWVLDEGDWRTQVMPYRSDYTDQGVLYQCESTNTWSAVPYYEPYTYPHPLTQLGSGAPTISSLTPDEGDQATTVTSMIIAGTNLNGSSPSITFDPSTGITTNSLSCPSAIACTVNVVIAPTAPATTRAVTITNSFGTSNAMGFDVNGLALTSISPIAGNRNSVVPLTYTGTEFDVGGGTVTENCVGTTVGSIMVVNSTTITASFTIAAGATLGVCQTAVITNNGTSNSKDFTVVSATAPTLDTVTPATGRRGTTVNFVLVGTGFNAGSATVSVSGTGVTVVSSNVVNDTTMTGSLLISSEATLGVRTLEVTTTGGSSNPGVQFTITTGAGGVLILPLPIR